MKVDQIKRALKAKLSSKEDMPDWYYSITFIESKGANILIEDEFGKLLVNKYSLFKGYRPSIRTALNKKKYYINQVNKVHNSTYKYDKLNYQSENKKITVTCEKHGDFKVLAFSHKSGSGCPRCANENHQGAYCITNAARNKEKWLNTKAVYYIINIYNEAENFYKVGITKNIKDRIKTIKQDCKNKYNIKIIEENVYNLYNLVLIEEEVKKSKCFNRYIPNIKFGGYTECFK